MLLIAVLVGAVGLERELRDREAGLRTHMLVGVGAALFVITALRLVRSSSSGTRRASSSTPPVAYVITGIGFLGAGTIIKHGINIKGLTTAASLWVARSECRSAPASTPSASSRPPW